MKKTIAYILTVLLLLCVAGCANTNNGLLIGEEREPMDASLFDVLGDKEQAFFISYSDDSAQYMVVRYDQHFDDATVTDKALMREMVKALLAVRVTAKTNMSATDGYHDVGFFAADGAEYHISFEQNMLNVGSQNYIIEDADAFWTLFKKTAEEWSVMAGKYTACTDEEIQFAIEAGNFAFSEELCDYLIKNQESMPEDVITCLNEHLGEYRVYQLSGADGALSQDEAKLTENECNTIAAVLQLHGYTPDMLIDTAAMSTDALDKLSANAEYLVDTSKYPKPEDGDRFLPFFQNGDAEVLAEAMGVTITAPREVTFSTFSEGTGMTVCAKITNTSDKTVQLLPAGDSSDHAMTKAEWEKVPGYDASLVIDWLAKENTDLIPLSAKSMLEPGESTVQRYTYVGRTDEDFDFLSRFSWRVTDGTSIETLAAAVLCHHTPSKATFGSCTVTGTVYNRETGEPVPFVDVQCSRSGHDYATTDVSGRFTLHVPAFQADDTGNWARATIFVNELGVISGSKAKIDPNYAEASLIVVPKDGETMDLTLTLAPKPAQVNYTLQKEHDLGMQAYGFDTKADIVVTTPFHTSFSEQYKFENGYLHVFDKTGKLLFEKPIYGEDRCCDVSDDGTLVAAVVHSDQLQSGGADAAVVWDISGNEVFSYKVPFKENTALFVKPQAPLGGYESMIYDMELSPDGTLVAIQCASGYVSIVRMADSESICDFYCDTENSHSLFFSKDGKVIYTVVDSGTMTATEIETGKVLWEKYVEAYLMNYVLTDTFVITSTKATGAGYLICTELATGKTLWTLDVGMRSGDMCLSHDEKTLFWGTDTAGTNERAIIIDAATGTPLWAPVSGKQAAAFSADDQYIMMRSGGFLTLRTVTGEHLYGANIAPDDNSMSWGLYMSGDCKNVVSFAGGRMDDRFYGTMYALTLDDNTPLD